MAIDKMPVTNRVDDDDQIVCHHGGRLRRFSRATLLSGLEQRMRAVENAPGNASLASRVGSIEQWREDKADAIDDVSSADIGVTIAGESVAKLSAVESVVSTLNSTLSALRQREIIND